MTDIIRVALGNSSTGPELSPPWGSSSFPMERASKMFYN
jgi:hypothetical protein